MRAFLAIELPEDVKAALAVLQAALPVGRAVPGDNLHLTLAFLGDVTDEQLQELNHGLEDIHVPPIALSFVGLGSFGNAAPKVLVAEIAENAALTGLHKAIRRAARHAGIVLARERYRPHVTLARFGRGLQWREAELLEGFVAGHGDGPVPGFTVAGFALFHSKLHRDGAVHDVLAEYGVGHSLTT